MRVWLAVVTWAVLACRPPGYGKHGTPDVDASDRHDGAAAADAPSDGIAHCDHAFRLEGHGTAASVWLTGDFVAWAGAPAQGAIAFVLGTDAAWTGTYSFAAGPHQYKLIIDATQWITDPTNPDTIPDGMGHTNSLLTCVP